MKKRILIVDDDKVILESLRTILQSAGYLVDTVESGRKAIEKSKVMSYNIALLNVWLPDMKDATLLVLLEVDFPEMVKIMITGLPPASAEDFLSLGADAYIVKPIHPEELLNVIKEKLREKEEATVASVYREYL
jgi:DNA-binding response OmpR family regulator